MDNLKDLRNEIDEIDRELSELLVKRMALSEKIAVIKFKQHLPILNNSREQEVINKICADKPEKDRECLSCIYERIFELSKKRQKEMMKIC